MTKPRHAPCSTLAAVAPADADLLQRVAALARNDDQAQRLRQLIQNAGAIPQAAWLAALRPTRH
ncbi:hypothetical protein [Geminicoccus flavidas]|uniref:hypothetical protein n=1 Tax=Geminicoccus flavidas TaxID=2506407 RepID=UPI00135C98B8|nr:hypothetical protein [Geminicoccus flavidas]